MQNYSYFMLCIAMTLWSSITASTPQESSADNNKKSTTEQISYPTIGTYQFDDSIDYANVKAKNGLFFISDHLFAAIKEIYHGIEYTIRYPSAASSYLQEQICTHPGKTAAIVLLTSLIIYKNSKTEAETESSNK